MIDEREGGMVTCRCVTVVGLLLAAAGFRASGADAGPEWSPRAGNAPRLRQPAAIALADDGNSLLIANGGGSVSVVDVESRTCQGEFQIGGRLAAIAALPNSEHVLVIDEERHELIGLRRLAEGLQVRTRLAVSASPVSLVVMPDGQRCCVASLWSRKLTIVDISALGRDGDETPFRIVQELPLPFAPREQKLLPGGTRLLVADAFGGFLAVVDLDRGVVESVREMPGHNIRGLGLSRDNRSVFVSHQTLNPLARTEQADIHWGLLAAGSVRVLSLDSVRDPEADILKGSWSIRPGDVGRGAGDPAGIVALGEERLLLAASGTGEILDIDLQGTTRRLPLGGRPTALLPSADGAAVYVVNAFSDSVAVLDPARMELAGEIPLGPMAELSPAQRGERLFYDAKLSHGGWLSCHSCHTDGHTNGLLADTLGDGAYGDPKRVLPLGGVAETGPWAWNGRVNRLEDQIDQSVRTTMHGPPLSAEQTADLAAFLRTLPPPPPVLSQATPADAVQRGRALFAELRCNVCHVPPTYTSPAVYDVGLADEAGRRKFNPPSLRGVGQRNAFFHDGRASSLVDVFSMDRHQLDRELTEQERSDLVEFLKGL